MTFDWKVVHYWYKSMEVEMAYRIKAENLKMDDEGNEIIVCQNCKYEQVEYDGFFLWKNAIVREYKCPNCNITFEVDFEKKEA